MKKVPDENAALKMAVMVARDSPCAKSKRGVIVFDRRWGLLAAGNNHPPEGFRCDGSDACREHCNKLCVHAEMDALSELNREMGIRSEYHALLTDEERIILKPEMLHVKVVDSEAVPSGHPSCWQCSRHIINFGIVAMWLLHEDGLRRYGPQEFHEHTLRNLQLPVIK